MQLKDICIFCTDKINTQRLAKENYISTDSLLPNFGGKTEVSSFPENQNVNKYEKGDILISNIRPYFKKMIISNKDGGCSSDVLVLRVINNLVYPQYLYYRLMSNDFFNYVVATSKGTKMPRGDKEAIMKYNLDIPNIDIQKKVVEFLDNIKNKIQINNLINDNLLNLGRLYFNEYINGCSEEVFIRDIADEVLDYTKNINDKVKLLNSSDITENIFPDVEFVDNKNLKGHFKKRFKKYDILYSQIRPRNHHYGYVLLEDSDDYLASTRLMVVRNKADKVSSSLLYYYLTSKKAVDDFTSKTESRSGTFPQGNYEDLSSFVVKYSSNQEVVTQVLNSILEMVSHNNNENNKLIGLRDLLLPKLMNGEIDLDKIEI